MIDDHYDDDDPPCDDLDKYFTGENRALLDRLKRNGKSAPPRDGHVIVAGIEKRLTTIDYLNERFAILATPGTPSVYISRKDFFPIQDADLRRRLAGEVVKTSGRGKRVAYVPAYKAWTENARRHAYRSIAFRSEPIADDVLNLFRGLGVLPVPGKCDRILDHIREVICRSVQADTDALLNLMAWQLQNIGKPSRIIVVLVSKEQQIGKGMLLAELLAKIYGPSGFTPSAMDQVIGRFNAAIRGTAFIFLDEVMFAGDRRAADAIKSLSTATIIGIEEKGLPVVQCPVAVNLWLASNHENAAHIEEHDARYWVLDVSAHRLNDATYFKELWQEIDNGGREAFAHYLLNRDVSNFVPSRDVPKENDAKREMVKLSINPFDARKWLEECARTGRLIGKKREDDDRWMEWVEGETHSFALLAAAYVEWQKTVKSPVAPKPTPISRLGAVLVKAGFSRTRTMDERRYTLPSPKKCAALVWSNNDRSQDVEASCKGA
jgi:hypothetical protein